MNKKACVIMTGIILLVFSGTLWFLFASTNPAFAATLDVAVPKKLIGIQPTGPLFQMENIAPGDVQSALLTITSTADIPCFVTITADQQNGDSVLADLLDITVSSLDQSLKYYAGHLSGLKQISLGSVGSTQSKEISLQITFPARIGNEAQGKAISMNLVIVAIAQEPSIPQGSGNGSATVLVMDDGIPEAPAVIMELGKEPENQPAIDDGQTPELIPIETPAVLDDETLPQGSLPGTGGIPFETIAMIGASLIGIGIGLKIRRKASLM